MKKSDQIKQIDQQIEALRNTLSVTADAILLLKKLKADLAGTKGKKKAPINLPHKAAEVPTLLLTDDEEGAPHVHIKNTVIADPDFPAQQRGGVWPFPRKP